MQVEAAAMDWFAEFHEGSLETFDWSRFEGWIQADPRHRAAYDRVEALWYMLDDATDFEKEEAADANDQAGDADRGAEVIDLGQRRAALQRTTAGLRQVG